MIDCRAEEKRPESMTAKEFTVGNVKEWTARVKNNNKKNPM